MEIGNPHKEYETDGRHVFSCQYHVIFCPKYRRKVLEESIQERLKEIILEKQKEYSYKVLEMEVMEDHVHMILSVNPRTPGGIYWVVSKIKGCSSHALREEFPKLRSRMPCLWSGSRFISTVGSVTLEIVKKYIEDQKGK